MNWKTVIEDFGRNLGEAVETARSNVREIVKQARDAVQSAEASILVPADDPNHLCFLISLNPKLDDNGILIPRNESISGFVFDSGQVIAKVKPESAGSGKADEAAGVPTEFLLAAPIRSDRKVIGVATFVNRAEGAPDTGFDRNEIELAQEYAELFSIALRFHQRSAHAYRLTLHELAALAREMNVEDAVPEEVRTRSVPGIAENLDVIASQLPGENRRLLEHFGRFLLTGSADDCSS